MSGAASKSAKLSNEVVADLEDAIVKMKLLKTEMAKTNNDELDLNAKKSELKALELTLIADRAEFEAMVLAWKAANKHSENELKEAKAKLDAERKQFEDEKKKLEYTKSRLEDSISKTEAAHTQLEECRTELETARAHLEAATSQTLINNLRLEAAKASLEASKIRFEAATNALKDAKSKFEDAKTHLLQIATSTTLTITLNNASSLEEKEEKINQLHIQISQLENSLKDCNAKNQLLVTEISNLKKIHDVDRIEFDNQKDSISKMEVAIKECKAKSESLEKENSKLKNEKDRLENELKECIGVVKPSPPLPKPVIFEGVNTGNYVVFFDMKFRGEPTGRIVMELYADTNPRLAETFRALCVGEKKLPDGRLVGYKGTDMVYVVRSMISYGGNVKVRNEAEFESIYGEITAAEISSNRRANGPGDVHINVVYSKTMNHTRSFFINGSNEIHGVSSYALIGRVIQGMDVVDSKNIPNNRYLDEGEFMIADCGQLY